MDLSSLKLKKKIYKILKIITKARKCAIDNQFECVMALIKCENIYYSFYYYDKVLRLV